MKFDAEPPREPVAIFGNAWKIYAYGDIDQAAPARAQQLIKNLGIPDNSTIYLDSPGGNVVAAIELGRIFRQHGLNTYVAAKQANRIAQCLSACTLAFIGGKFRYLSDGALYGVHRFFAEQPTQDDMGTAQVLSSIIVNYIREMDVDPDLFMEMTKSGKDEMNLLSKSRMEELGVVNNGVGRTYWSIESIPDEGLYLLGARDSVYGTSKFMVSCTKGVPFLLAMFDPQRRADEVLVMGAQSLLIDGTPFPIADYKIDGPDVVNGWIAVQYRLDERLLMKILNAQTVGVSFQYAYDAPIFLGFDGMEISSARGKLSGLLSSCH